MKKIFTLSILSMMLLIFLSACDECESEATKLRITSFEPTYMKINRVDTSEGGGIMVYASNYTIDSTGLPYDSIGISVFNRLESFVKTSNLSLINSAYACDPVYYFYGIDSLFVYSDQRYDANHPAGSNLRDLIKFNDGSTTNELNEKEIQGSAYFIYFKSAPDNNKSHIFTIKCRLYNGNSTSSVLPKVKILKP